MAGVEEVVVQEPSRGRDANPSKSRKDKSRDAASILESRLARIELAIADSRERLDVLEQCVERDIGDLKERIEDLRGDMQFGSTSGREAQEGNEIFQTRLENTVMGKLAEFETLLEDMRDDWALCKRAVSGGAFQGAPKKEIPKPKEFDGKRDAKEVDNFIWHMERYFEAVKITDDREQIRTATLYLADTATLWWRRRHADIQKGTCTIDSWDDFKKELKKQFYPEDAAYLARKNLKKLKQTGSIRDYVKEFSSLMLEVPNMSDDELLFNFMDNLQPWAEVELRRCNVQNLAEAIAIAESLIDYRRSEPPKKKPPQDNHGKGGGDKGKGPYKPPSGKDKGKQKEGQGKKDIKPKTNCFLCDGPHWARECPKRKAINALVDEREKEMEESHMGSLRTLTAIKAQPTPKTRRSQGLMYLDVHINGKATRVMVDTGATNSFVSEEEARRLGLKVSKETGWLKAVNSKARPLIGMARGVSISMGNWNGKIDLTVAPMDDFEVVLGMDFLEQVKVVPLPFLRSVAILEDTPCIIPAIAKSGSKTSHLSALQVKKGLKKGEVTYLAAVKHDEGGVSTEELPKEIKKVLEEYKDVMPGKANLVADALSRKAELATMRSAPQGEVISLINEGLQHDSLGKSLVGLANDGKTKRFWVQDDLLYTVGNRLYVPKFGNLRKNLIKECHDTKWAGHPGQQRTRALLEATYYWPHMRDDIEAYVKTCLVCQQDKNEQQSPGGLLEPLPIPERPWESVTMDFISALPKSDGCGSIMVVVDRFSKYATFIAAPTDCTAEQAARLFLRNVVKYWGVPRTIISDRDPRFTGKFWTELFNLLGSKLHFSTSFHPQTDGQTERVNALLELYLRHFVSANQRDWAKLLDVAQFSYNLQRSEVTHHSPFELATGQQPLTPQTVMLGYTGRSPGSYKLAKDWQEQADIARSYLDKAARKMKKWADKKRRRVEFQVGDLVLVKLLPQQFKAFRKVHKGLVRKYEGPFPILKKVGKVSYKVELPPRLKIHPVFHVSHLKPYHADTEDPSRGESSRAPTAVVTSYDKEVEEILADRVMRKRGVPRSSEYLIKWKGLPTSEATWEPKEALWQFAKQIEEFHKETTTRTSPD
ncbi:hypothetical protein ACOSQ3_029653 [Xanthoceras sorbifolium]